MSQLPWCTKRHLFCAALLGLRIMKIIVQCCNCYYYCWCSCFVDDTAHQLPTPVHMVVALDQLFTVYPSGFKYVRSLQDTMKSTRHTLILIALVALICVEHDIVCPQRKWFCESCGPVMGNALLFVFWVDTHHQLVTTSVQNGRCSEFGSIARSPIMITITWYKSSTTEYWRKYLQALDLKTLIAIGKTWKNTRIKIQ